MSDDRDPAILATIMQQPISDHQLLEVTEAYLRRVGSDLAITRRGQPASALTAFPTAVASIRGLAQRSRETSHIRRQDAAGQRADRQTSGLAVVQSDVTGSTTLMSPGSWDKSERNPNA